MTEIATPSPDAEVDVPPAAQLMALLDGYLTTQVVYLAAKLGLADLITAGVTSLRRARGNHRQRSGRPAAAPARPWVGWGVVTRDRDGDYRLTSVGQCLRRDDRESVHHLAVMSGEDHYRVGAELLHSVRTGEPGTTGCSAGPGYPYLAAHPTQPSPSTAPFVN